ncbi:MAG: hypothetical protein ACTSUC_01205 [Promethearchaeota archaeon]
MTDTNYKIKIKIGQNEIDLEGDKEWVEEKIAEFKQLILSSQVTESADVLTTQEDGSSTQKSEPMPKTLAQFYREKGEPRKHVDKVIIFAYWLTKVMKRDSYNINDIMRCYDEARIKKPANISDIMNKVNPEYLLIAPDKENMKAWRISLPGEKYVESLGN